MALFNGEEREALKEIEEAKEALKETWEVEVEDDDDGSKRYEIVASDSQTLMCVVYEEVIPNAKDVADLIVRDHNSILSRKMKGVRQ